MRGCATPSGRVVLCTGSLARSGCQHNSCAAARCGLVRSPRHVLSSLQLSCMQCAPPMGCVVLCTMHHWRTQCLPAHAA
eukprot:1766372-Alexandrium_andersonii.AAC.1